MVVFAALALLAGCGGDDDKGGSDRELSAEEKAFAAKLTAIDKRIDDAFAKLGSEGQGAQPTQPAPAVVKKNAEAFVKVERKSVKDLQKLTPPKDAESAVKTIIAAARKQADDIEAALKNSKLTMGDLGGAVLASQPPQEAFTGLADKGYLPPQQ